MFVDTSAPATFDFGASYGFSNALLLGDDELDLFVFLGEPKDILNEYTNLTGKAAMPPLWSFGLWMSRITYFSEDEVRSVAAKLRQNRIPADVIHLDTGWFEHDWRCDYKFSTTRFKGPGKMIADLKQDGFHISLWQLPYFVPQNSLFPEILAKGLAVKDGKGNLPYEDAVLDFTNPAAVAWYAAFLDDFRRADEMKYRLMPYIYAQAKDSSERGLPMVRALFIEYPGDPGAWQVEDEYLFGADILVAPLLEAQTSGRDVYLPQGQWIDYQTGKVYPAGWHRIEAGRIPIVMLAREGAVIPQMQAAQSTARLDWSKLEMVVYAASSANAQGLVCLPSDHALHKVEAARRDGSFALVSDPLAGKAASAVRLYTQEVR